MQATLPDSATPLTVTSGKTVNFDDKSADPSEAAHLVLASHLLRDCSEEASGGEGGVRVCPPSLPEQRIAITTNNPELVYAAGHNEVSTVVELLSRQANPDSVDHKGRSALHRAAGKKHNKIVWMLLEAKADLEKKTEDEEQMRPLHCATLADNLEGVRMLLGQGADAAASNAQVRAELIWMDAPLQPFASDHLANSTKSQTLLHYTSTPDNTQNTPQTDHTTHRTPHTNIHHTVHTGCILVYR